MALLNFLAQHLEFLSISPWKSVAGVFRVVVLFFPRVSTAMKASDKLDIWKDLKQVGTDRDKVNQATSVVCSMGEEAGDFFHCFQLTDARDGEKVRDKCSAHFVPHIRGGWTKEARKTRVYFQPFIADSKERYRDGNDRLFLRKAWRQSL